MKPGFRLIAALFGACMLAGSVPAISAGRAEIADPIANPPAGRLQGVREGDAIVLASTDFNPRQAEERTVTAVSGNTLTLDKPLQYMHFGEITYGVDERGEVAHLKTSLFRGDLHS